MKVRQLPPWEPSRQVETPDGPIRIEPRHPLLYCRVCGGEYSANPGDYFAANPETVFTHCGRVMALVQKRVVYDNA